MHSGSSTLTTRRVISTRTIASTPGAPPRAGHSAMSAL